MLLFSFSSHMLGADSEVLRLLVNSYQCFPRFSGASYGNRTRSIWKFLVNIYQKFDVMHDSTRRFIFFTLCTFAFRLAGSCMARDLNVRYGTCKEFLLGVACGLARVCDSLSHLNFRRVRSRVALRHNSRCSMCRQSPRQSASTMRSAAT